MKIITGFWIALGSTLVCCETGTKITENDVSTVLNNIIEADNRADVKTIISLYESDAVLLPPGKEPIAGTESIRDNYEAIFRQSHVKLAAEVQQIDIAGNIAVCTGRTMGDVYSKADSIPTKVNDKFVMILKKKNDSLRISRLIWNRSE